MAYLTEEQCRLAVGNRAVAYRMMGRHRTRRCAWALVGDSNALKDDHGFLAALDQTLDTEYTLFGAGLMSAVQGVSNDFGSKNHMRRHGGNISGVNAHALNTTIALTGATWVAATKTLTKVGGFSTYGHSTGNTIASVTGTGVTNAGPHVIASKVSDDAITLATEIAAGDLAAADIAATVYPVPPEFRNFIAFPSGWLPHVGIWVRDGQGSPIGIWGHRIMRRRKGLGSDGPQIYSFLHAQCTVAGGGIRISRATSAMSAFTTGIGTLATAGTTKSTTGTNGTLAWETEQAGHTTDADRMTGGSDCYEYITNVHTGPLCALYGHLCSTKRTFGASVSAFFAQGGMSRYDMANLYINTLHTDTKVTYWRAILNQFQTAAGGNGNGAVIVPILSSFNDFAAAETATSLGSAAVASNTAAGFTDNAKALIAAIDADILTAITAESLTAANIERYYVLICEHALATTPTAAPSAYVTNADCAGWGRLGHASDRAWAESQTTYNAVPVDLSRLATWTELCNHRMLLVGADSDPSSTTDDRHLCPEGYNAMTARMLAAMDAWQSEGAAIGGTSSGWRGRDVWR